MSLIDSQIIDVALKVNPPESVELFETIRDVSLMMNSAYSVDLLGLTTQNVNIVSMNTGPRGPKGDSGQWVALTQSEYDALNPPDPDILYIIIQ